MIYHVEGFLAILVGRISLNEYDDIVTISFFPLKGANVVQEFQKKYSGLIHF